MCRQTNSTCPCDRTPFTEIKVLEKEGSEPFETLSVKSDKATTVNSTEEAADGPERRYHILELLSEVQESYSRMFTSTSNLSRAVDSMSSTVDSLSNEADDLMQSLAAFR